MRKLMRNNQTNIVIVILCGCFFGKKERFVESDDSCIFHGQSMAFLDEDLIVFVERIRSVELLSEECHAFDGHVEDEFGVSL